jgi:UDP-glucose:(heptosyl)LPS alpha-1,3-glucosyltransferase
MNLAFLIYSYFPYGGQQRDFLRVANACVARGHKVVVYTMKWQGEMPTDLEVKLVDVKAWSRHALYQRFTARVTAALQANPVDAVVGFNKMPGLDLYFAADPCFAERAQKQRGFYYRFTPRYRHFMAYEEAVFGAHAKTQVLLLSPLQRGQFEQHYPYSVQRFHDIPPGISRDRQMPENAAAIRASFRHQFRIAEHELAIVQIGSGFVVKGVDRSLRALASLPESLRHNIRYFVVGQDKSDRFRRLARRLGIAEQCEFLGGRDDVPRFLLGADLMLHPAYSESAGYTLLESVIAGLPVLTTATCGYAFHIERAGAGIVSASPFDQNRLNKQLLEMLTSPEREQWRANGIAYGRTQDLYSMPETVASLIEDLAKANAKGGGA